MTSVSQQKTEKKSTEPGIIGGRLRASREAKHLSQEYVALRLGRTKGWLSKVENNRLSVNADMVREFGSLLGWNEEDTGKTIEALG